MAETSPPAASAPEFDERRTGVTAETAETASAIETIKASLDTAVQAPEPVILTEVTGHIGTITLNNTAKRNALSSALLDAITSALDSFKAQAVRVVIVRGQKGIKVWSAGHDIKELRRGHQDPLGYADPLEQALRAIRSYPGAVIAMVQGSVWGGAFDLVLSCDMIVADETSTFAITPVNLGLPYNTTGLLHCLNRLPVNFIKEMFFTASPVKAEAAARWGIINHLVPSAEIEAFTLELSEHIATKAPLAIAVVKEQLRVLTDFQPVAAQVFERIQNMRREVYESADYEEGIDAFLEKRKPNFQGR
ncbi:methylmalonyl-CoA decarboxylase [Rhodomicrobium lacus]|uniref:methylmalonyl-CoA decarboxylase n=1 Tax=Rhodomicrobium lacus TaxID=2498452 RepID=UPI000F8D955E|nr:methylmalonyl-CoA decarboxylase [Rhodomicrobium lacus]